LVTLTLFRAFSAWILQLPQPGPMAQAVTFRAFGAGTPSFDTASLRLGENRRHYQSPINEAFKN
jgi:hypothetical protein